MADRKDSKATICPPRLFGNAATRTSYVLGRYINKGGFGSVYQVEDVYSGAVYACKIISLDGIKASDVEKIKHEISVHQSLSHPHVVKLVEAFQDGPFVFIVMEYCQQQSLFCLLERRSRLTELEVRYYMCQLLYAVCYLHEDRGLLHRDLKIGNVLITQSLQVKLADFGFAQPIAQAGPSEICGTPNYLSPEVLNRKGHSMKTESWAIGCILYALLCGRPPFHAESVEKTYKYIQSCTYHLPSSLSSKATSLIKQLLQRDPAKRPSPREILRHPFFCQSKSSKSTENLSRLSASPHCYSELLNSGRSCSSYKINGELSSGKYTSLGSLSKLSAAIRKNKLKRRDSAGGSSQYQDSDGYGSGSATSSSAELQRRCQLEAHKIHQPTEPELKQALQFMHRALTDALMMPPGCASVDSISSDAVFVTKWMDYTNKYGFGCQFSDGSASFLFNDGVRISLPPNSELFQIGHYGSEDVYMLRRDDERLPDNLAEKFEFFDRFYLHMTQYLQNGASNVAQSVASSGGLLHLVPHVHSVRRLDNCIFMLLADGTIQVNFFTSHEKIAIRPITKGTRHASLPYIVTYVDKDRTAIHFPLAYLTTLGRDAVLAGLRAVRELVGQYIVGQPAQSESLLGHHSALGSAKDGQPAQPLPVHYSGGLVGAQNKPNFGSAYDSAFYDMADQNSPGYPHTFARKASAPAMCAYQSGYPGQGRQSSSNYPNTDHASSVRTPYGHMPTVPGPYGCWASATPPPHVSGSLGALSTAI